MWSSIGTNIKMAEGDFGIELSIEIEGPEFTAVDSVRLTIKDRMNGSTILEKEFDNITDNTVTLELTSSESALLSVGEYVYSLDWYQLGHFLCNIVLAARFIVEDKA